MAVRRQEIRPPPLLDPKIKRECECDPAPLVVDNRAVDLDYHCIKCGHSITTVGLLRLLRYAYRLNGKN